MDACAIATHDFTVQSHPGAALSIDPSSVISSAKSAWTRQGQDEIKVRSGSEVVSIPSADTTRDLPNTRACTPNRVANWSNVRKVGFQAAGATRNAVLSRGRARNGPDAGRDP